MAANRPACARLVAVAPAGRSAASYTITRDTTQSARWPRAVLRKEWLELLTLDAEMYRISNCSGRSDHASIRARLTALSHPTWGQRFRAFLPLANFPAF